MPNRKSALTALLCISLFTLLACGEDGPYECGDAVPGERQDGEGSCLYKAITRKYQVKKIRCDNIWTVQNKNNVITVEASSEIINNKWQLACTDGQKETCQMEIWPNQYELKTQITESKRRKLVPYLHVTIAGHLWGMNTNPDSGTTPSARTEARYHTEATMQDDVGEYCKIDDHVCKYRMHGAFYQQKLAADVEALIDAEKFKLILSISAVCAHNKYKEILKENSFVSILDIRISP